jgi:hypothetical protein
VRRKMAYLKEKANTFYGNNSRKAGLIKHSIKQNPQFHVFTT